MLFRSHTGGSATASSGYGGGGGYRGDDTAGGKGGLPYIFFCSNIDFSTTVLQYGNDIKLSIAKNSGASIDTYIAYLQKEDDNSGDIIYIKPDTTSISYPPGCDENNTLFYYNQSDY